VPDQLLTILKFCLLALIYLFFLRVLRAVWAEITPARSRGGAPQRVGAGATVPARGPVSPNQATAAVPATGSKGGRRGRDQGPGQLVVVEPAALQGRAFAVKDQLTIGRSAQCQIAVDDTFVSQMHARVFPHEGQFVVEDLGSTNGTYLNRSKLSGAMVLQRGDRIQVGNTVLELQ
jgi:pSer/pThr/pTyr-binding forkhead associated (FHA) protein